MKRRVVVAMSGGVDSSVAAACLVEQGYEVVGITLHLAGPSSRCCSLDDAEDARRVAEQLGIRFYVANYREAFQREVIEPFVASYLSGRTPVPCVECNRRFKFEYLLARARALGADAVATGHYARVATDAVTGARFLLRGADPRKDQSYFLFNLSQEQLRHTLFPVGELHKDEVRERAAALGLATAAKPESQEICFVGDGDTAGFVERTARARLREGPIVDESGRVLGRHRGIHRFTVGQRRGLRVAAGRPLYVKRIEPESGRVVVSEREGLAARGALLRGVSWIEGRAPEQPIRARVRVRARHGGEWARVEPEGEGRALVRFERPVLAVAPGQAAVFYQDERVLGGGWIEASLP